MACGCWIWTGATDKWGVPTARTKTSQTTAARREWMRENGPVPEGKIITKDCAVKLCIRPRHHRPATWGEVRYRTGQVRVDTFTAQRAFLLSKQGWSRSKVAHVFGVSRSTVQRIASGDYPTLGEVG